MRYLLEDEHNQHQKEHFIPLSKLQIQGPFFRKQLSYTALLAQKNLARNPQLPQTNV